MMEVTNSITITKFILTVARDILKKKVIMMLIIQPTITIKEAKAYHRLHCFTGAIIIHSNTTEVVTAWAMNLIMVNIDTTTCQR